MPSTHAFTAARQTAPDLPGLTVALRAAVAPELGIAMTGGWPPEYLVSKTAPWTPADIGTAQLLLDTHPAATPQLAAQAWIDQMPIGEKAFILALIDQLNVLRALHSLQPITPPQAIAAIRTKAGTL